jgi:hypothetical protein
MVEVTSMRRGARGMQVAGQPASPKLAGLGFSPFGTAVGMDTPDAFLMAGMVAHQPFLQLQGRPALTRSVSLVLARLWPFVPSPHSSTHACCPRGRF